MPFTATVDIPGLGSQEITAPTREELIRKAEQLANANRREKAEFGEVAAQSGAERLIDTGAGLLNLGARGVRDVSNAVRSATGQETLPKPFNLLGLPSGRKALSTADSVTSGLRGLLGASNDAQAANAVTPLLGGSAPQMAQRREQRRLDQPLADFVGNLAVDAGFLGAGRAAALSGKVPKRLEAEANEVTRRGQQLSDEVPGVTPEKGRDKALDFAAEGGIRGLRNAEIGATTDIFAPAIQRAVDKAFRPKGGLGKLARTAGRAGEASFEGALLSAVQGGDPIDTALLSGGSQVAGMAAGGLASEITGFDDLMRGKFGSAGKQFALFGAATAGIVLTAQALSPDAITGDFNPVQAIDAAFDKAPYLLALGLIGGFAGAGRAGTGLPAGLKGDMPEIIADAFNTLPRTAVINLAREYTESRDAKKVIDLSVSSPGSFTEDQIEKLSKGMQNGKLSEEIEKLIEEDEKFRNLLDAPDPRLADVPVKDEE